MKGLERGGDSERKEGREADGKRIREHGEGRGVFESEENWQRESLCVRGNKEKGERENWRSVCERGLEQEGM